jgi:hypothetical protein
MCFYPSATAQASCRRNSSPEVLLYLFFIKLTSTSIGVHGSPKLGPRRPKVLKKCKKSCQKLTFGSQKRDVYVRNWREWPLAKTSAGAMFSSHYEGPGPSFFAPKLASGTHCAPGTLFFTLLGPLLAPKRIQGRPRDTKKSAKHLPKPPRGHLKSIRNRPGTQPWYSKGPGKLQGYPRDGK